MPRMIPYPIHSEVRYRDNDGDLIIATVVIPGDHYVTVRPDRYAAEPHAGMGLPERRITGDRKLLKIPVSIIEERKR